MMLFSRTSLFVKYRRARVIAVLCAILINLVITDLAIAQSDENVDHRLERGPIRKAATWMKIYVVDPALAPIFEGQTYLHEELNLELGVASTIFLQASTEGGEAGEIGISNLDMFGRWRPIEGGSLGFKLRDRRNFGQVDSADFAANIGSIWRTNDSLASEPFTALIQLWWQQRSALNAATM